MIARLRGTVVERRAGAVVIDCLGVGYEVHCSDYTLSEVGPVGSEVALRVYTHFQENKLALYGFASAEERQLFDLLITVKNVGPSSAVKILSAGAGPRDLARMITDERASALKGIKGVGKKTAELLVVELRDSCRDLCEVWGAGGNGAAAARSGSQNGERRRRSPLLEDVSQALCQLGWKPAEVEKTVAGLEVPPDADLESLLRKALRSLSR